MRNTGSFSRLACVTEEILTVLAVEGLLAQNPGVPSSSIVSTHNLNTHTLISVKGFLLSESDPSRIPLHC